MIFRDDEWNSMIKGVDLEKCRWFIVNGKYFSLVQYVNRSIEKYRWKGSK